MGKVKIDEVMRRWDKRMEEERVAKIKAAKEAEEKLAKAKDAWHDTMCQRRGLEMKEGPRVGEKLHRRSMTTDGEITPKGSVAFRTKFVLDFPDALWELFPNRRGNGIVVFVTGLPPEGWTHIRVTRVSRKDVVGYDGHSLPVLTVFGVFVTEQD